MQAIERARLEDLLAQYWEIAFEESSGVTATGNKANQVLHEIRAIFNKLEAENERLRAESEARLQNCAALVAEVEQLRKDAERKPMHEGEIQAAWLGQGIEEPMPYTFELGIRSAERFNGIKGTP